MDEVEEIGQFSNQSVIKRIRMRMAHFHPFNIPGRIVSKAIRKLLTHAHVQNSLQQAAVGIIQSDVVVNAISGELEKIATSEVMVEATTKMLTQAVASESLESEVQRFWGKIWSTVRPRMMGWGRPDTGGGA